MSCDDERFFAVPLNARILFRRMISASASSFDEQR
jgi:hypothetical protein